MRKGDFVWAGVLLIAVFILVSPFTSGAFVAATKAHPYIMGFIKVSILATMGELMACRITTGRYRKLPGLLYKFIVWGFLGMCFALVFDIFAAGVANSMKTGLLPSLPADSPFAGLLGAFFTSTFTNLIFAPTFMLLHRITDTYIDLGGGKIGGITKVKLSDVTGKIDWQGFMSFVLFKTIPIFWIPAHTVTFMLPSEYRVVMAAFLSIALGGILAFAKRDKTVTVQQPQLPGIN